MDKDKAIEIIEKWIEHEKNAIETWEYANHKENASASRYAKHRLCLALREIRELSV